jgi:UMF1 family MFS transporter
MQRNVRLTRAERAWILYDVGNSAYTLAVTTAIFPIFFKTVVAADVADQVSTSMLGSANTLAALAIAVLAPVLGSMADYEGGKKRLFSLFFIFGVVSTLLLATVEPGAELWVLTVFALSGIGFAGANVFYDSLLPDVTTPGRMHRVSTAGFAWGYIGSTIPFMLIMGVIVLAPRLELVPDVAATRFAFVFTAIWWAVFTIPLLRRVKQTHSIPRDGHAIRGGLRRLTRVFREIRQYRNLVIFLAAYFLYIDGVGTIIKMATAFGTDIGLSTTTLLVVLLVIQLVAFPFALLYGYLAKATSAKLMLSIGIGVYVFVTIGAFLIPRLPAELRVTGFWVVSMLLATSQGGIQAISRSFYAQMIPAESAAEFFGFYNIFGKFAAIIGPFLFGQVALWTGDTSFGALSLIVLFVGGFVLLQRVQEPAAPTDDEGAAPTT